MRLRFIYHISLLLFFVNLSFVSNAQFIEDNFEQNQYWSRFNMDASNNTFCIIDSKYSIKGNSIQICTKNTEYVQIVNDQPGYTFAGNVQSEIFYREIPGKTYYNIKVGFDWKCNGEESRDFGSIHYSTDKITWQLLKNYQSGKADEVMSEILLLPKCLENKVFYLGFSFTSDNSFNFQPGLVVDNFKVYGNSCTTSIKPSKPTNNESTVCFNDEEKVTLTANSSTNNLRWYKDDNCDGFLYEGKEYRILPTNTKTLFVTSFNPNNGCESDQKAIVNLIVRALPKLDETTVVNAIYGKDGSIEATASGAQPLNFLWTLDSDPKFEKYSLDIDSLNQGNYKLIMTDVHTCKDSFKIVVLSSEDLRIPKGISPNDDGHNDVWEIDGIKQWEDFSVELRNLRGDLVYRQDATDNSAYVPMDGKDASGLKLPSGDYTYVIRSKSRKRNYTGILSIKYD
jgi:gliding motility-associated-like protein